VKITLPKPWPEFLADVDKGLDQRVDLHCVGGFILVVLYGAPRTTSDLDYISIRPSEAAKKIDAIAGRDSRLANKYKVFLQGVGVADFPADYEIRLQKLELKPRNLCLWALDPYDLILSKLTRNSPTDMEDVKFLAKKLKLQFTTLYSRWEQELKPYVERTAWHEQTLNVVWRDYFASTAENR